MIVRAVPPGGKAESASVTHNSLTMLRKGKHRNGLIILINGSFFFLRACVLRKRKRKSASQARNGYLR